MNTSVTNRDYFEQDIDEQLQRNQSVQLQEIGNSTNKAFNSANARLDDATDRYKWKPGRQEWLVIMCLCVVALVVALDATILTPALPVRATTTQSLETTPG